MPKKYSKSKSSRKGGKSRKSANVASRKTGTAQTERLNKFKAHLQQLKKPNLDTPDSKDGRRR